ncbi:MarR family transcriptional regulator [Streptomyces sp. NPDC047315]|uniref:MarR family winged helix-turn-helix transcriptional regulator n=1 Tax=Streptomyces sp. NPDC047315 TaxID=3155142 RepID=UPI0033F8BD04
MATSRTEGADVTESVDAVSSEVLDLLTALVARYITAYDRAAAEHSLTAAQAKVLALLTKEPLPMRQLADRLVCEPSNITGIVDRLELRGLVERHPDPHDRRVKFAVATDEGAETTQRLKGSLRELEALAPLADMTAVEQRLLRDLLKRLLG